MSNQLVLVGDKQNLKSFLEEPQFLESLRSVASKFLTPERVAKIALLAASRQPDLYKCTKASFLQAIIRAAECGLEFGGVTGQGYLVPYRNGYLSRQHNRDVYEAQFIPGYQGFIELCYRSGRVPWIDSQLVYEKDQYDYALGDKPFIKHKPFMGGERGRLLFGYVVAYLNGAPVPKIEIMSFEDMDSIRNRAKSKEKGPWITDPGEMYRKTVVRRARKWLPQTPEMEAAIAADNADYDMSGTFLDNGEQPGVDGCMDRMRKAVESQAVDPRGPGQPIDEDPFSGDGVHGQPEAAGEPADLHEGIEDLEAGEIRWTCDRNHQFSEPRAQAGKPLGVCPECGSARIRRVG